MLTTGRPANPNPKFSTAKNSGGNWAIWRFANWEELEAVPSRPIAELPDCHENLPS
jgi:hypothetical protein